MSDLGDSSWRTDSSGNLEPRGNQPINPRQLFTGSRPVHTVVHEEGGTVYADGPDGEVASGTDPHAVINTALSNAPTETKVSVQGRMPSSSTTIELVGSVSLTFDYLDYTGSGWAMENPNKTGGPGNQVSYCRILGERLACGPNGGSGVDFYGVSRSAVYIERLTGQAPAAAGTYGYRAGNSETDKTPSWWNAMHAGTITYFDTNVKTRRAANRIDFDVRLIEDSGTYGVNLDDGNGITFRFADITDGPQACIRINGTGMWGRAVVETDTTSNDAAVHIAPSAGDYDFGYKIYSAGGDFELIESDSGFLRDMQGANRFRSNNLEAVNKASANWREFNGTFNPGGSPSNGTGWFWVDDGSTYGEGDLMYTFTDSAGTTKTGKVLDFSSL